MLCHRLGFAIGLGLAAAALAQSTPTLKHIDLNNNYDVGPYYPSGWTDWGLIAHNARKRLSRDGFDPDAHGALATPGSTSRCWLRPTRAGTM